MIANVFWRGRAAKLFGWLGVLALLVGLPSMLASTRANATTYYHLTFFLNNSNVPAGIGLLADGVGNMQFAASPVFTIDLTASQLNVVVPNPTGHIGGHASPFALLGVSG
ncbi:MAG: hypothetical protein ACXWKA_15070, partial [Xanthobacteraceae bacterium]